ncbi:uncharacterized protein TNCV_858621 [Trichonephila clavipes]|nr:uncharacterized protein TNCV_858621 [Trichonephila clavipes]
MFFGCPEKELPLICLPGNRKSPRVAAVDEWYRYRIVACLVTSSSPIPLKIRRIGQRCALNLPRAETSSPWCGVVVRRGGVPDQHGGTINSRRATSPLVRLVKGEERLEASDHPQGVLPHNWGGI